MRGRTALLALALVAAAGVAASAAEQMVEDPSPPGLTVSFTAEDVGVLAPVFAQPPAVSTAEEIGRAQLVVVSEGSPGAVSVVARKRQPVPAVDPWRSEPPDRTRLATR